MKVNVLLVLICLLFLTDCSSCSQSGRRKKNSTVASEDNRRDNRPSSGSGGTNVIKMKREDGVYKIPVKVNGILLYFIFDTGASSISMSQTETNLLYKQGTLTDSDIKGTGNYMDATGKISEGTIINLKEVEIGSKVLHNIEASVVNNMEAPLLLGQSALAKFGKISIDYQKEEITFE